MGVVDVFCRVGLGEVLSLVFASFICVISWTCLLGSCSRRTVSVLDCLKSVKRSGVGALLGTLLGTLFVLTFCAFLVVSCESTNVKLAFENGPQQHIVKSYSPCYVNRSTLIHVVGTIMTMQRSGVYYLVNGPHGCGKSTALKEAVAVSPPRTLYFEVSAEGTFPLALAETLSIEMPCHSPSGSVYAYLRAVTSLAFRRTCSTDSKEQLLLILSVLKAVVKDMEQHPTLVIDNLSALFSHPYDALGGKELIRTLQGFAKSLADNRLLSIVLAGSEGKLIDFLYESSSASRLDVYDMATDISFEEAVTYLTGRCPQTAVKVTDVVKLVGGRFIHLCLAAATLTTGNNLDVLKKNLFGLVEHELADLKIELPPSSASSVLSNTTWRVAKALLDAPERKLTYSHFAFLLQELEEREKANLSTSNLFLSSFGKTVYFQSPLVQAYFEKLTT